MASVTVDEVTAVMARHGWFLDESQSNLEDNTLAVYTSPRHSCLFSLYCEQDLQFGAWPMDAGRGFVNLAHVDNPIHAVHQFIKDVEEENNIDPYDPNAW